MAKQYFTCINDIQIHLGYSKNIYGGNIQKKKRNALRCVSFAVRCTLIDSPLIQKEQVNCKIIAKECAGKLPPEGPPMNSVVM